MRDIDSFEVTRAALNKIEMNEYEICSVIA